MNGHNLIINRVARKLPMTTIKIMVTKETGFDYDLQPLLPEPLLGEVFNKSFVNSFPIEPIIFTGLNRPTQKSLWFVQNQWLEMHQGEDCSDGLFASWFLVAVQANPIHIKTYESDGAFTNHNQPEFNERLDWSMKNLVKKAHYATA